MEGQNWGIVAGGEWCGGGGRRWVCRGELGRKTQLLGGAVGGKGLLLASFCVGLSLIMRAQSCDLYILHYHNRWSFQWRIPNLINLAVSV